VNARKKRQADECLINCNPAIERRENMKREIVSLPGVAPVKHLSKAVKFGSTVYVSGTTGRAAKGDLPADITGQTKNALGNIKTILEAAGSSMDNILKTTCYLADIQDKNAFNDIYVTFFPKEPPARACFAVASLGPGVKIEIEAIACIPA
jgi:2-iminobutanoate/2-iminopropanoate deaminase